MAEVTVSEGVTGAEAPVVEDQTARPEWLPENFKTPEDLVKSYKELQSKLSASGGEDKGEEQQEDAEPLAAEEEAPKEEEGQSIEDFPENLQEFAKEFSETGALTEDSYAKLAEMGFSKSVVDSYISGVAAAAQDVTDDAFLSEVAEGYGGVEKLQEMMAWGAENLTEAELELYNQNAVKKSTAKIAIEMLKAKFEAAEGFKPARRLEGLGTPPTKGAAYESWQEVQRDMADKRYKEGDPAFHRKVEEKLRRSNL